jgi:hypothetical protein
MKTTPSLLAPLAAVAMLASGCSGTSGTGATGFSPQTPLAQPAHRGNRGSAVLRLLIPKRGRHTHYISAGTASIVVLQNGKSLGTFDTSANSGGCSSTTGGTLCTFSIAPKAGSNQVFTINAYSHGGGTGSLLSSGSTAATVLRDVQTTISVTMGGVVASLSVVLPQPNPPAATAASVPVVVQALDAAGYTIVGAATYTSAITLTDADTSGITKLAVNGGAATATVTVASPNDTVKMSYNGKNIGFAPLSATTRPPGSSTLKSPVIYFMPQPTLVKAVGANLGDTSPYVLSPFPDSVTHSLWLSQYNYTAGAYQLVAVAPNGSVRTFTSGQAPSTNLPNCASMAAIDANGPNHQVWFVSGCNPGSWGFLDPTSGATTSFTAPGHFANFAEIAGAQPGDPAIYATIYDYNAGLWSTVRADASGNIGPELSNGQSNAGPLVGSSIYEADEDQLARVTITGSGPTATLTDGGTALFTRNTVEAPIQAADGTLWDSIACSFTHTVPKTPFSTTAATDVFAPAALCQNAALEFETTPAIAPDGSIWTAAGSSGCRSDRTARGVHRMRPNCCCADRGAHDSGGTSVFGTLTTAAAASAPFSVGGPATITIAGQTVPFEPYYVYIAADGNLAFSGVYEANNQTTIYSTELAY